MSQSVDKRVVEMRFDNKQFESGVKESLGTLDKLKNVLDKGISSKSIDDIGKAAKNTDMSQLVNGVQSLADRFSTLGIVGMRVIENITDGLMNGMGKAVSFVTDSIVSGGFKRAMNIENARFQLQGILSDASEVEKVMNQASESVDGTAYSFDAAAKAASMFTASGIESGDQLMHALRGLAGATATFNADYESMSMIWTKISGQGRVMGDELNQLSNKGMNAAASIAQYFNNVNSGTAEASEEVSAAIQELTHGLDVTEGDIREFVTGGEISFAIFSEAMSQTFGEHAKDANKTFTGALSNIKAALARTGEGLFAPLIRQEGPMVNLFNAIRIKINEFNKAFRATGGLVDRFVKFVEKMINGLTSWIENLQIANTWIQKFGDGTTKVFSDAHHKMNRMADGTQKVIRGDFYTPFSALQDIVMSIANLFKALGSIIKPIGQAFKDVFSFNEGSNGLYIAIERFRQFTEGLKLSEKNSEDLRKAFKGLFSIVKSVVGIIGKFIKALIPGQHSAGTFGDTMLEVAGSLGEALETLSKWIDESVTLQAVFEAIHTASTFMANAVGKAFGFMSKQLEGFDANDALQKAADRFNALGQAIYDATPEWAKKALTDLSTAFAKLGDDILNFNLEGMKADFETLGTIIETISNDVLHLDTVKEKIVAFFDFTNEESGVNNFKSTLENFIDWFKTTVLPIFDGVSLGGLLAGGGGLYAFIQMGNLLGGIAQMFRGAGKTLTEVPKVLQAIRKEMVANQHDINATALLKVAAAIGVLCGAIFALAQIEDTDKLIAAAIAVGTIAAAMLIGLAVLEKLPKKMVTIADALKSAGNKLAKAINKSLTFRAIGASMKDLALAIGIIIGTVAAIMYLWDKDSEKFKNALSLVGIIAGTLILIVAMMGKVGQVLGDGMKNFGVASIGVLALAAAMLIIVGAVKEIMEIELPGDWENRLKILGALFLGVAGLAIALGIANRISGSTGLNIGKGGLSSTGGGLKAMPILAMCALIYTSVKAIKEVMNLEIDESSDKKLDILKEIFISLAALIVAVGIASGIAGGSLKAGGTILAMCIYIYAIIGALKILDNFKEKSLMKGMKALAGIIIGLSIALVAAGQINGLGAGAAILAMVFLIGSIVTALGILSMISWQGLLKGALSLAGVLIALSITFAGVGKINNGNAYKPILAMCLMVGVIATALAVLSGRDWAGMLTGALGISGVLLALTYTFRKISGSSVDPKKMTKKIGTFLLLGLSLAEIAVPLAMLSTFDWPNMLASAAAISAVLLAYTKTFQVISSSKKITTEQIGNFLLGALSTWIIALPLAVLSTMDWKGMLAGAAAISMTLLAYAAAFYVLANAPQISLANVLMFLLGSLATLVIGFALSMVANLPWQNMLAAAGSISAVLLAYTLAFAVIAVAGNSPGLVPGIAAFLAGTLGIVAIGYALNQCAGNDWKSLLAAGVSISMVVLALSVAMLLCTVAGAAAAPALIGIGLLDVFIADLTGVLAALGALSKIPGFNDLISAGGGILTKIGKALGDFVGSIIEGIGEGVGRALEHIGTSLSNFAENAQPFFNSLKSMDKGMLEAAGVLVGVVLALAAADFISAIGSLVTMFTGQSGIDQIGPNLQKFGSAMKTFQDSTQGVDPGRMKPLAEAGKILMEMAKEAPNSGGLAGFFAGENDLGMFGENLAAFADALSTWDVKTRNITGHGRWGEIAEATKELMSMAKDTPNSGGVIGWLAGNNDLGPFGTNLAAFADSLSAWDIKTRGITGQARWVEIATGCKSLFQAFIEIPNSGGLVSFFTGDNDVGSFGTKLVEFGTALAEFDAATVNVNGTRLATVASAVKMLAEGLANVNMTGGIANIGPFVQSLGNLARAGLEEFINAFSAQGPVALDTVRAWIENVIREVDSEANKNRFRQAGTAQSDKYLSAIKAKYGEAKNTGKGLGQKAYEGVYEYVNKFQEVAKYCVQGFINGLRDSELMKQVRAAAKAMAEEAKQASMNALNESSPSKDYDRIGSFAVLGFVNGLYRFGSAVSTAGADLANTATAGLNKALEGLQNGVDNMLEADPVITPMVDLTNVLSAADQINALFSSALMNTNANVGTISKAVATAQTNSNKNNQNEESSYGNTYNFVQNNTSPKALSRIEIYRDSRNLFRQYREAVEGV